jgi:tetratricopeptide (TPR) repeat protein
MKHTSKLATAILFTLFTSAGYAADLKGADAIIAQIQGATASPAAKTKDKLQTQIDAFTTSLPTLNAPDAAAAWLVLLDHAMQQPAKLSGNDQDANVSELLLRALPAPDSWPAIEDGIAKRPTGTPSTAIQELGWKLFARILAADQAGQLEVIKTVKTTLAKSNPQSLNTNTYDELLTQYLSIYPTPPLQLELFNRSLARLDANRSITVPDLVDLVGEKRTRDLAKKLLKSPDSIDFQCPEATQAIFRQVALQDIDSLPAPHWELIKTTADAELFLAFEKKVQKSAEHPATAPATASEDFAPPDLPTPTGGMRPWEYQQALSVYLTALLSQGNVDQAVAEAQSTQFDVNPTFDIQPLLDSGHAEAGIQFLESLLTKRPQGQLWDTYIQLASHADQTERMLKFVTQAAATAGPSSKPANALRSAQLAADDVEPAIQSLRAAIAQDKDQPTGDTLDNIAKLLNLGVALHRPELTNEASTAAIQDIPQIFQSQNADSWQLSSIVGTLLQANQTAAVEQLSAAYLAKATRNNRGEANSGLTWLATAYDQAGRNQDVLTLLQKAPWWGASDLSAISSLRANDQTPVLGVIVAKALLATNHKPDAQRILLDTLKNNPKEDDAYELLLPLMLDQMPALCDQLYACDAFEARPLIWKAEALRRLGKLEEAEKVARQAVTVDPSDGESPHGRRMKVYAVLSDILKDRNQPQESQNYAQIVAAIRMAESADDLYAAGLLKHAIARYEEALTHFSDAYCIQSRLAIKYADAGQDALAEQHYQRAFELMPESFGRIESHCFGCERAFDGAKAQSIAERVFNTLAKRNPEKPQVHYLLGYLREDENKPEAALESYRQAVKLDPDYFNAWSKISSLLSSLGRGANERDVVIRNLARLDPLDRHPSVNTNELSTVADFWTFAKKAKALKTEPATNLFRLDASAKVAEATKDTDANYTMHDQYSYNNTTDFSDPYALLKSQNMVGAALQLIQMYSTDP